MNNERQFYKTILFPTLYGGVNLITPHVLGVSEGRQR